MTFDSRQDAGQLAPRVRRRRSRTARASAPSAARGVKSRLVIVFVLIFFAGAGILFALGS